MYKKKLALNKEFRINSLRDGMASHGARFQNGIYKYLHMESQSSIVSSSLLK